MTSAIQPLLCIGQFENRGDHQHESANCMTASHGTALSARLSA